MQVQPYLFFAGRCEEALDFYRGRLGAEVTALMRWSECPETPSGMCTPGSENTVMHASFTIGKSTLMASVGPPAGAGAPDYKGFALSLLAVDPVEAELLFTALGDGGQVQMPLGKTFFSPAFGMVSDRFGVSWMVVVE
ncbi:MAG: VOC family protein [Variovorax sp.]